MMTTKEKSSMIGTIISALRFEAWNRKKHFKEGEVFLSLCFKTDDELRNILRLTGI